MGSEAWPQSGDVFYWARSDTGDNKLRKPTERLQKNEA